jgi:hypothetical protein
VNAIREESCPLATSLGAAVLAVSLLVTSCAGEPGDGRSGEIVVELYSGFVASAPALPPARTHFVVDVSELLPPDGSPEDEQRVAQALIAPYVAERGLGLETAALHAFRRSDAEAGSSCSDRSSGASLAASMALARLDDELARSDEESRVVLVAALQDECTPSLCEAAARIAKRGTWLDVASLGGDPGQPACLGQLRPSTMAPIGWLPAWSKRQPPAFTIESVPPSGREPVVLARGVAGTLVRAPAGVHRVRVALDPPEVIGPVQLRAGERLRIRIMDFPLSAPGARTWEVESVDARP